MSILKVKQLKKYYGSEENLTKALDGLDLSIEKGEFVAIVGASGSGKSTLLNMIGGLDVPTSGKVVIGNKEIEKMKPDELTVFRRKNIGFIFQNYNLIPVLNVLENITLPIELDGRAPDKKFVKEIIEMLGLKEKSIKCHHSFPADNNREWRLREHWPVNRRLFSRMNRQEILTLRQARKFWSSFRKPVDTIIRRLS